MAEFTYESEESDEEHDYVYVDRNQFGGTVELQPSNEQNQFFERVCFNLFCNVCHHHLRSLSFRGRHRHTRLYATSHETLFVVT